MSSPSHSPGSVFDAQIAPALTGAMPDMSALELLLRDMTARLDTTPDILRSYDEATRVDRHRSGHIWFGVNLAMLAMIVPIASLTAPAERVEPLMIAFTVYAMSLVLGAILLPRCRSAWSEDLLILMPCLILLVGGGFGSTLGDHGDFYRHGSFHDVIICSVMIFVNSRARVHALLISLTVLLEHVGIKLEQRIRLRSGSCRTPLA